MSRDLFGFVMKSLRARHAPLTDVARGSGVPYDTLKKIASGATPNPGVKHVQALAIFFDEIAVQNQPAASADQARAATENVAQEAAHA